MRKTSSKKLSLKEKKQIWKKKLEHVDEITDKLGKHIDEGIKETVAILHLFGIPTFSSHEGKIHRYAIPYVDIEAVGLEDLHKQLKNITGTTEEERDKARLCIENEITVLNLVERKKLILLLEEFYTNRKVSFERRLVATSMSYGWTRLQSQWADFQEVETDEKMRKQRLAEFQREMRAFTIFLKKKYFKN